MLSARAAAARTSATPAPTYAGCLTTAMWSRVALVLVTRCRSALQRLPPAGDLSESDGQAEGHAVGG
jgi:hypothetical protein